MESEFTALQTVQPPSGAVSVQTNNPTAFMLQALAQGASIDQLEKMMDLQERFEKREAEKAFIDAFSAFRGHNITVPKSKFVDRGKAGSFQQAEYEDICKRISPALSEHGLSFRHDQKFGSRKWVTDGVENDIAWVYVTCYLEHRMGHSIKLELEGPPGDLSANTATQNMQVTASYLKRQSLLAITGTATGGEDDENKLHRRGNGSESHQSEQVDSLINEGRSSAMEGTEKLNAWWGTLDGKQRKELSKEFGQMRNVAKMADQERAV